MGSRYLVLINITRLMKYNDIMPFFLKQIVPSQMFFEYLNCNAYLHSHSPDTTMCYLSDILFCFLLNTLPACGGLQPATPPPSCSMRRSNSRAGKVCGMCTKFQLFFFLKKLLSFCLKNCSNHNFFIEKYIYLLEFFLFFAYH